MSSTAPDPQLPFIAVIMAGGQGQRFWPLSTAERPKQFLEKTVARYLAHR